MSEECQSIATYRPSLRAKREQAYQNIVINSLLCSNTNEKTSQDNLESSHLSKTRSSRLRGYIHISIRNWLQHDYLRYWILGRRLASHQNDVTSCDKESQVNVSRQYDY